jgi:hypothetical protein
VMVSVDGAAWVGPLLPTTTLMKPRSLLLCTRRVTSSRP